jgi:hypothetical protein
MLNRMSETPVGVREGTVCGPQNHHLSAGERSMPRQVRTRPSVATALQNPVLFMICRHLILESGGGSARRDRENVDRQRYESPPTSSLHKRILILLPPSQKILGLPEVKRSAG